MALEKKRIANGSGTDIATINKLLKQFKMMSEMMKKMSKGDMKGMADKGIPPELFNQLNKKRRTTYVKTKVIKRRNKKKTCI